MGLRGRLHGCIPRNPGRRHRPARTHPRKRQAGRRDRTLLPASGIYRSDQNGAGTVCRSGYRACKTDRGAHGSRIGNQAHGFLRAAYPRCRGHRRPGHLRPRLHAGPRSFHGAVKGLSLHNRGCRHRYPDPEFRPAPDPQRRRPRGQKYRRPGRFPAGNADG